MSQTLIEMLKDHEELLTGMEWSVRVRGCNMGLVPDTWVTLGGCPWCGGIQPTNDAKTSFPAERIGHQSGCLMHRVLMRLAGPVAPFTDVQADFLWKEYLAPAAKAQNKQFNQDLYEGVMNEQAPAQPKPRPVHSRTEGVIKGGRPTVQVLVADTHYVEMTQQEWDEALFRFTLKQSRQPNIVP